jgi:pimeloyl-ACP methyl ester carboxylesterase
MSVVLVHGVPETARLWDGVRRHLNRDDIIALSLPGFGNPRPAGFGATMNDYADWLVGQLEQAVADAAGPVDLVGHDWGGGFVMRVVSTRPDLVRTWVTDAAGVADVEFEWHDFAKIWQTPGAGEAFWEQQLAAPVAERVAIFTASGVPEAEALVIAEAIDQDMADCILALYRSATKVSEEWGPAFEAIPKPGMVVVPTGDPFLAEAGARRAAQRAGATVTALEGRGHWWMLEDPSSAAELLTAHWRTA